VIPKRAETAAQKALVLKELLEIWHTNPDMRLGQLIDAGLGASAILFFVEDTDLIDALRASEHLNCPE
jgi:hypothetical protein